MSTELIGILAVGVALAGLILASKRDTNRRLTDTNQRLLDTNQRLLDLDRRLARVEALLEGLGLSGRSVSLALSGD